MVLSEQSFESAPSLLRRRCVWLRLYLAGASMRIVTRVNK